MTTNDDTNVTPPASPGRLPTSTLLIGAGALLLLLGAFLPWVKVFAFGISGVDTDWGIVTLLIGVVALVAAFGAGRIFDPSKANIFLKVTAALGVVAVAIAVYVGFAIRDAVAEDETGTETSTSEEQDLGELGEGFEDAFSDLADALKPTTGVGVYATLLGGALVAAGGILGSRRGAA
jgi:uncharacterized membrane protein YedE/YeeE